MSTQARSTAARRLLGLAVAGLLLGSCTGEGSDIGPNLTELEQSIFSVSVRDSSGAPVVDATVEIGPVRALTAASGTAELEAPFGEETRLRVLAGVATAQDGQQLGSLTIELGAPAEIGAIVPFVVHLPDLAGSAEVATDGGPLPAGSVLDDSVRSGARIDFATGTTFSGTTEPLRVGGLPADRIPPLDLVSGAESVHDAVFVGPAPVEISPPATLSFPNTLGLAPSSAVTIARLDAVSGSWRSIGDGVVSGDGSRIEAPALLSSGGLHTAFVPASSVTLEGRVLLNADSETPGVSLLLRQGQSTAVTDLDGLFSLADVVIPPSGTVLLRIDGGLDAGTDVVEVEVDLSTTADGAVVDLGDLLYEFIPTIDFRAQFLARGQLLPFVRIGALSLSGRRGVALSTDASGQIEISDTVGGFLSLFHVVRDERNGFQGVGFEQFSLVDLLRRTEDTTLFALAQPVTLPPGATVVFVRDRDSRGFVSNADLFAEVTVGDVQLVATTGEGPPSVPTAVSTPFTGVLTAVRRTTLEDGRESVSAETMLGLENGRAEFLLDSRPIAPRASAVLVRGRVPGAGPDFELVRSPILDRDSFFELFLDRYPVGERLEAPRDDVGPADADFIASVAARAGASLIATSGSIDSGRRVLGAVSAMDVSPDDRAQQVEAAFRTVDSMRTIEFRSAMLGLDSLLASAEPRAVVGMVRPDRRVAVLGEDLQVLAQPDGDGAVRVPRAEGFLGGATVVGLIEFEEESASTRRIQRSVFARGPSVAAPLLPLPVIRAPASGEAVSVDGFDVEFTLPEEALYGRICLVRDDGLIEWSVVVPPDATSTRFEALNDDTAVLEPGNYRLELKVVRIDEGGVLTTQDLDAYQAFLGRRVSFGSAESRVSAVSSISFPIEIVP